jgi:uncharacterized protein YndB with AHSA1/START domain
MNPTIIFNFQVDKENKTIRVERSFDAPANLVWAAWTQAELLDQWWAPKPYQTKTKFMDFRDGGYWLYAMTGPNEECHWCRADYQDITPQQRFSVLDAFCDEQGTVNTDFPRSFWTNEFSGAGDTTTVHINIRLDSLADLERIIEMGFKEGFTAGLENLDALLVTLKK